MMPCGSSKKNRRFGGTYHLIKIYSTKQRPVNNISTVMDRHNFRGAVARGSLRHPSWGTSSLRDGKTPSIAILNMEAICFSETLVLPRATRRHTTEDNILHCYRSEKYSKRHRSSILHRKFSRQSDNPLKNQEVTAFWQDNSTVRLVTYATSCEWAPLQKLSVARLLKSFPKYYETLKFIAVFTRALHWTLS
jgi:hypothetical protein